MALALGHDALVVEYLDQEGGAGRKPLGDRAMEWVFRGGLAFLLALMLVATFNDLGSFGLWDRVGRLIG